MSGAHEHLDHAHHFESVEHEFEAGKLGMWLFLVTEVMLFGVFFAGYGLFHYLYPEMFKEAHHHLDKRMGALNTVVLLISSLTMALSIAYIQRDNVKRAKQMLLLTLLCAAIFMVVKYFEYSHKIHLGILPGDLFKAADFQAPNIALFFSFYFVMTGTHGLHVLIGMAAILWIYWRMGRGDFNSRKFGAVEFVGLYWHIVDLIWIFLFPLVYLVV
ncbi:MAG: cytochrome c oxidase subunit 3 family protein [Oligoflexia bacterium]|nr:cytochrome c oxidase subunit 3 family protein [Oligoflexia bacterium]